MGPTLPPTLLPTLFPTPQQTYPPTPQPTMIPSPVPTGFPTERPTVEGETREPTLVPTVAPTMSPTEGPCLGEPEVPNSIGISWPPGGCAGTQSREYCFTGVICAPGFFSWSGYAYCMNGEYFGGPVCAQPFGGFGHLAFTTSDGALFAYHKTGVLRLWESPPNDMELQVRTLTPGGLDCEATLIGMVALRAADNIVSVVGSEDVFDVRFNGARMNLTEDVEYRLGSGPDELMIQYRPEKLIVTSKRGAKFDFNFYPFAGMSWLTVPHTLNPNVFLGNTQGLLGIYDDDPFNDFTMRNGTQLPVLTLNDSTGAQTEFGNSWLLSPDEWLFGVEENAIADADPEYLGFDQANVIECPTDFSNYSVPECDVLDPQFQQVCYFDVIVGGPQFLEDVEYSPVCGNNTDQYCSFHGTCAEDNSMCICFAGWEGLDCGTRQCPTSCVASPNGGQCDLDTGFCLCDVGWTGEDCELAADCTMLDNCNADIGGGACIDDGLCQCDFGYLEPNCTAPTPIPTPFPTEGPSPTPTMAPTGVPTQSPTSVPTIVNAGGNTSAPTTQPDITLPTPEPDGGAGASNSGNGIGAVPGWGIALIAIPLACCCCILCFFGYRAYKKRQEHAEFEEKDVHAGFDDKPVTRNYDDDSQEDGSYGSGGGSESDQYYSSDLSSESESESEHHMP